LSDGEVQVAGVTVDDRKQQFVDKDCPHRA
jgi:hypothetical protein